MYMLPASNDYETIFQIESWKCPFFISRWIEPQTLFLALNLEVCILECLVHTCFRMKTIHQFVQKETYLKTRQKVNFRIFVSFFRKLGEYTSIFQFYWWKCNWCYFASLAVFDACILTDGWREHLHLSTWIWYS